MIQPGIVAAQAASAGAPITREYFAAEQAGAVTGSDASTNVELVALEATLAAGDWAIFWTCELQSNSAALTGAAAVARVAEDDVEIDSASAYGHFVAADTEGWTSTGGFYIHAGTGAPVRFTIDVRSLSEPFPTVPSARNGRIVALKLTADDVWVENTAAQTDESLTPVDAATLNFTPPSSGDYLFIGYAQAAANPTEFPTLQLSDGVLTSDGFLLSSVGSAERVAAAVFWLRNGLSAAQTISLQYFGLDPDPITLTGARILALRLDGFTHAFRTVSNADEQGPELAYTDSLVLSRQIAEGDYLALASWGFSREGASSVRWQSRFGDPVGPVNEIDTLPRPKTPEPHPSSPGFSARIGAYAAGRRAWSIQRQSPDAGDDAIIRDGAAIVVLQLF